MSDDTVKEEINAVTEAITESKAEAEAPDAQETKLRALFDASQEGVEPEQSLLTFKDEKEEEDAGEDEVSEETEDEPEKVAEPEESRKAREQLRLKGFHPKAIEALSETEAVDQWTRYAKNESDVRRAFRERASLEKEVENLKATLQEAEPTPAASVPKDLAPLFDELGIDPKSDAAKALVGALGAKDAELAEIKKDLRAEQETRIQGFLDTHRERLGKSLPRIKTSDRAWNRVVQTADEIAVEANEAGTPMTPEGAFDQAVQELYGDVAGEVKVVEEEKQRKAKQRKASTPTSTVSKPAPKKLSPMQKARRAFDIIERNPGIDSEKVRAQIDS